MLPNHFTTTDTEPFYIDGQTINIPKSIVRFDKWTGDPVKETFGGKPVLNVSGKPMFAELAIMTHFQNDGWQARWVETYGKTQPIFLTAWIDDKYKNQVHVPFADTKITQLLADIATLNNNSYSGCWDLVASKGDNLIFAESKRSKKDSIRTTQVNWLSAALKYGLKHDNFLVVQWDM
jgi:hypothetical protein